MKNVYIFCKYNVAPHKMLYVSYITDVSALHRQVVQCQIGFLWFYCY